MQHYLPEFGKSTFRFTNQSIIQPHNYFNKVLPVKEQIKSEYKPKENLDNVNETIITKRIADLGVSTIN